MKERTKAWLEFAARDLEAARKLADDEYLANVVLFHSQQCIEKCLKAVLEEYGQNVPKIHGVNRLYELIMKNTDITLPVTDDELDFTDDVYIDTTSDCYHRDFPKRKKPDSFLTLPRNCIRQPIMSYRGLQKDKKRLKTIKGQ